MAASGAVSLGDSALTFTPESAMARITRPVIRTVHRRWVSRTRDVHAGTRRTNTGAPFDDTCERAPLQGGTAWLPLDGGLSADVEGPHSDDDAPLREVTPAPGGSPVNFSTTSPTSRTWCCRPCARAVRKPPATQRESRGSAKANDF
jgi:hypothetical protein